MRNDMYGTKINYIEKIITALSRIPGFSRKMAKRTVIHLLQNKPMLEELFTILKDAHTAVSQCDTCGNLDNSNPCYICLDRQRNKGLICVVESIGDVWAIEKAGVFKGVYHVLGGVLSPIDGVTPDKLRLGQLKQRVSSENIAEVVLAISSTLDGQTTAYYISDMFASQPTVKISRLALGIPMGASLQYIDEGTLSIAMQNRENV